MSPDAVINIILAVMIASYIAFLALYLTAFPWRETYHGRAMVGQKITLTVLAGFFLVESLVAGENDPWTNREALIVLILLAMAWWAVATFVGLVKVYRKARVLRKRYDDQRPTQE